MHLHAERGAILTVPNSPRRGRPPKPERPLLIADAVLRVLAEEGSKGLSHRRVDREAGLPIGSTVHHAPMRIDLFRIAVNRLNEMTISDLRDFEGKLKESADLTPQSLARRMVDLWRRSIEPDQFYRLRAEMAILYSQEYRDEVHGAFHPQLDEIRKFWARVFTKFKVPDPDLAGLEFAMWNRGVFSIVASCEGDLAPRDYAMIERWVIQMMQSLVDRAHA